MFITFQRRFTINDKNLTPVLISGVSCYEQDGTAYLRLEDVARGLGFTDVKNGIEYVRWPRVDKYLADLGFATCGERPDYEARAKKLWCSALQTCTFGKMRGRHGAPPFPA